MKTKIEISATGGKKNYYGNQWNYKQHKLDSYPVKDLPNVIEEGGKYYAEANSLNDLFEIIDASGHELILRRKDSSSREYEIIIYDYYIE